jgi:hypothetical protein
MLDSFCLVAITGSVLGIINNHDDNNDDTTLVLSMFMLFVVNYKIVCLIRTWRTSKKIVQPQYYMALDLDN